MKSVRKTLKTLISSSVAHYVCAPFMISGCVVIGWQYVFRTKRNWRGQLCLYLELVVSSIRPPCMYFGTIRFWSCLSKQINSHDIQNINTLMSEQNGIDFGIDIMCSFVYKFSILRLTSA